MGSSYNSEYKKFADKLSYQLVILFKELEQYVPNDDDKLLLSISLVRDYQKFDNNQFEIYVSGDSDENS